MPGYDGDIAEAGTNKGQVRVYVAGPYTQGDWGSNIADAIDVAQRIHDAGHVPFIPHTMTSIWSVKYDNDWIEHDLEWLEVCDVMFRIPGESEGADSEEQFARENGIPIYESVAELIGDYGLPKRR